MICIIFTLEEESFAAVKDVTLLYFCTVFYLNFLKNWPAFHIASIRIFSYFYVVVYRFIYVNTTIIAGHFLKKKNQVKSCMKIQEYNNNAFYHRKIFVNEFTEKNVILLETFANG